MASSSGVDSRLRRSVRNGVFSPRRTVITKFSPRKTMIWPVETISLASASGTVSWST